MGGLFVALTNNSIPVFRNSRMTPFTAIVVLGHILLCSDAKILPALSQSYLKDKGSVDISHCRRSSQCFPVNQTTCLGGRLPHNYTSSDITGLSMHHTLVCLVHFEDFGF